ncbi:MAG: outer membrane protein assembly factor BamD, partial [candidate division WOR-3 bacterium]|nr:outer membrane protein assembly factor BamD [candidate division WOR-3 bacterium]
VEVAVSATEEVKSKMTVNPRIYKPAYGYGLALLYNHYYTSGEEAAAEEYAKKLQSELGTTEYIEQLYYDQAMRDTSVANIGDLRGKIEMIRARNSRSTYLPDPLFLLSLLLIEDKSFDEAKDVLVELKTWPDISATRDRMPDISYQLARVHFQTEKYADAVTEFESWTRYYETGETARTDLAPFVYYFLGLSYYNLGDQEASPQVRAGYYRKALKNFEVIKETYADSDFYTENTDQVERFISQCRKGIG